MWGGIIRHGALYLMMWGGVIGPGALYLIYPMRDDDVGWGD